MMAKLPYPQARPRLRDRQLLLRIKQRQPVGVEGARQPGERLGLSPALMRERRDSGLERVEVAGNGLGRTRGIEPLETKDRPGKRSKRQKQKQKQKQEQKQKQGEIQGRRCEDENDGIRESPSRKMRKTRNIVTRLTAACGQTCQCCRSSRTSMGISGGRGGGREREREGEVVERKDDGKG